MIMCTGYMELNKVIIKNKYPMPIIDGFFNKFKGAMCFPRLT